MSNDLVNFKPVDVRSVLTFVEGRQENPELVKGGFPADKTLYVGITRMSSSGATTMKRA